MRDGTIFLDQFEKKPGEWLMNLVGKAIAYRTGSPYTHTGWFADGYYYDDTIWKDEKGVIRSGVRKSSTLPFTPEVVLQLKDTLTHEQSLLFGTFSNWMATHGAPYGILRLLMLWFLYPLRWLWKAIGWTPFDRVLGDVCSTAPAEALLFSGIEAFPGEDVKTEAPGDWLRSPAMERIDG